MNFTQLPFDPHHLPFSTNTNTNTNTNSHYNYFSFRQKHRLFEPLLSYVAANLVIAAHHLSASASSSVSTTSFSCKVLPAKQKAHENNNDSTGHEGKESRIVGRVQVEIGLGLHQFRSIFDPTQIFYALYQQVGEPVGTNCEAAIYESLVLFSQDASISALTQFLADFVELIDADAEKGKFKCFTWHIRYNYWREEAKVLARPMDSVVLPSKMKERLMRDVEKFLKPSTEDFYQRNGIPYRRSYLFYGVPGTGKTSMVQALAGHFHRSVCFLLPTHPQMTDDSLREAMSQLPENCIVVFEDIDSLFAPDRQSQVKNSSLTFSGLLNALDGIGNSSGQIYILTTNLRDKLDPALIRNGRVDLHIEFSYAIAEQMEQMWKNFYPEAAHLAKQFSEGVEALLEANKLQVTTSALQHFFVSQMESTPEEALDHLTSIVEELKANSSEQMLLAASTGSGKESSPSSSTTTTSLSSDSASKEEVSKEEVSKEEASKLENKVVEKKKKRRGSRGKGKGKGGIEVSNKKEENTVKNEEAVEEQKD